jgi:hypothetical protein
MDLDLDIEHYDVEELKEMLGITTLTPDNVIETIRQISEQFQKNPQALQFFNEVKERLLEEITSKTEVVSTTEVKRDILNPELKHTLLRHVNVDSFYRQLIERDNANTDNYNFILNEPIKNVLSVNLYSIEIPYSWYTFSNAKGTTGFGISTIDINDVVYKFSVSIPEGNYTPLALLDAVNRLIADTLTATPITAGGWYLEQNPVNGCAYIYPSNGGPSTNTSPTNTFFYTIILTWFDSTFTIDTLVNSTINHNLGWYLGFRDTTTILYNTNSIQAQEVSIRTNLPLGVIKAPSIVDTSGTKYIVLCLADYKTNRINKGMISINNNINPQIDYPSYLNADINQSTNGSTSIEVYAMAPRRLTASQLYTINAISKTTQSFKTRVRINSSDNSDVFAKIPLKGLSRWGSWNGTEYTVIDGEPGKLFIEFSGPLQNNAREYFGPVDLSSLKVSLYDDKGNLLGLNGMDWSFTLMVSSLYQY